MIKFGYLSVVISLIIWLGFTGCNSGNKTSETKSSPVGTPTSLSWSAPFQYNDGGTIAPGDIVGYKIYYRTESGTYSSASSSLVLASATTVTVNSMISNGTGTYYFVVTAIDKNGNESDFSNEVKKVILPM